MREGIGADGLSSISSVFCCLTSMGLVDSLTGSFFLATAGFVAALLALEVDRVGFAGAKV